MVGFRNILSKKSGIISIRLSCNKLLLLKSKRKHIFGYSTAIMKNIILLVCLFIMNFSIYGQHSPEAKKLYESGIDLAGQSKWKAAIDSYAKAVGAELTGHNPDSLFLASCYEKAGIACSSDHQYMGALKNYRSAFHIYYRLGELDKNEIVWNEITGTYKILMSENERISSEKLTSGKEVHVEIKDVKEGRNDTLWIRLKEGANLGIEKGMSGYAVQKYKSGDRDYKILNPAVIQLVSGNESKGYVLTGASSKTGYLLPGDQVVFSKLKYGRMEGREDDLFKSLGTYNISFSDMSRTPFYNQLELLYEMNEEEKDFLIYLFKKDVVETVATLKDLKNPTLENALTDGKFKGLSVLKAMEQTTKLDIEMFLRFVTDFPGKYLGNTWKINETYATWVLNGTPLPSSKTFMVNYFVALDNKDLDKWVTQNSFYLDTLKTYIQASVNNYIDNKSYDSAGYLLRKAHKLTEQKKDAHFSSILYVLQGRIEELKGGESSYTVATDLYSRGVASDSTYWLSYLYRGNLYGDHEEYNKAIKDYKVLNRMYPYYADGFGNIGWWYLKQFLVKDAGEYCKKAYELDSSVMAWTINLAHYNLLTGKTAEAKRLYYKTLENLQSESEFVRGPLSDFEFFGKAGMLNEAFNEEKAIMVNHFNNNFKYYLQADSLFAIAKKYKNDQDYKSAVLYFTKSRDAELQAKDKREQLIHNRITWIGYSYYFDKDYANAEKNYLEALAISEKELPLSIANDYALLAEMYLDWGKKSLSEAYSSQSEGLKRKMEVEGTAKDLYVLSIGIDNYKDVNYQWASEDAKKIGVSFNNKGNYFRNVYNYVLTNKEAIGDSLSNAVQSIISKSKPGDTFIFYFTGRAVNNQMESYLLPYGFESNENDSLIRKNAISAKLLRFWSNNIKAEHQLYLLDAASSSFTSAFANESSFLGSKTDTKDVLILAATFPRIENKQLKGDIFANAVSKFLSKDESLNDGIVTSKKLESYLSSQVSGNNYYLSLESFSVGRDFTLATYNNSGIVAKAEIKDPEITRGGGVNNISKAADIMLKKRYGLFIATDEYKDTKWPRLNNPIDDAKELKKELEDEYGFEIQLLSNPSRLEIMKTIDEYSKKEYDKNDQLVILFAGHGLYNSHTDQGYLIPSDAPYTQSEFEFDDKYYPMTRLFRDLTVFKAQHVMVLLDACHGGAICSNALTRGDDDMYRARTPNELMQEHLQSPNRVIITSGRKDQNVYDGVNGLHSPFISAILTALKSTETKKRGSVSYNELITYINKTQKTQATTATFTAYDNSYFYLFYTPKSKTVGFNPNQLNSK